MKKLLKKALYIIIAIVTILLVTGLILAYAPVGSKTNHKGITQEEAAQMRHEFRGAHHTLLTSDGETLFLRRWDPIEIDSAMHDITVLIFYGFTAHSGAYDMTWQPISEGGFTTFGLDYRGHGLSGGNRGDNPGKDRWFADLAESVLHVKSLGFSQVVVLGHSLGVASAMCTANAIPKEVAGLVLLSGAYEGRKGLNEPPTFFQQARIVCSAVFRPSHQAVEYYREGMTVTEDPLFNFRYTLRFLTMLDVKELRLPTDMNIPVLVGTGDQDELFEIEKVREFYDLIPGEQKEFLVMKNTTHAKIPRESWLQIVAWLDRTFGTSPVSM